MSNIALQRAKDNKNDEWYTEYDDIEKEINNYILFDPDVFRGKTILMPCDDPEWSNFTSYFISEFKRLGLKKLISTSFANNSKPKVGYVQTSLFEQESPQYDKEKTDSHGKIFIMTDKTKREFSFQDLKWKYLKGDGDFNSDEVKKLRDEADIIITNPPFSKACDEFIPWVIESGKKYLIVGDLKWISYKNVFPLIMDGKLWLGCTSIKRFKKPDGSYETFGDKLWFTNLDHGKRHEKLVLSTMEDNIRFSGALRKKFAKFGIDKYTKYDNYDAIDVPIVNYIPSDYKGMMGVPVSFLQKYNPDQFEIVGMPENEDLYNLKTRKYTSDECKQRYFELFGKKGTYDLNAAGVLNGKKVFQRILIKPKGE